MKTNLRITERCPIGAHPLILSFSPNGGEGAAQIAHGVRTPFFSLYPIGGEGRGEGAIPRIPASRVSAFTLIELVISSSLMAIILVSAYLCLNAGVETRKLIEPRSEIFQNARTAMAIMSADFRSACPLSKDYDFLGMQRMLDETVQADNVDFATHHYNPRRPNEGDFCEESFFLQKDLETGHYTLWRRRNPLLATDPLSGGVREVIARGLLGMRLEYYDGYDWYDNWGEIKGKAKADASLKAQDQYNLTGMPEAVRITLWFDSNTGKAKNVSEGETSETNSEPALVFQTVARLNLADVRQPNSSGGADTNTPPTTGMGDGSSGGGGF